MNNNNFKSSSPDCKPQAPAEIEARIDQAAKSGPLAKWEDYCNTRLSWKHGSLDVSSWNAFLRAAALGIARAYALQRVCGRLRRARADIHPGKIESQLARAYDSIARARGYRVCSAGLTGGAVLRQGFKCPPIDFEAVERIVSSGPTLAQLLASDWHIDGNVEPRAPQGEPRTEWFIDRLFPGNPLLCVGGDQRRFATGRREDWRGKLAAAQFIVPSPMSAARGRVKNSSGRFSAHTLDNTGRRRFLVIEFDIAEFDKNGAETVWTPLVRKWREGGRSVQDACAALLWFLSVSGRTPWAFPLAMVLFTGGKSLHGWFYCQGAHEGKLAAFMRRACLLGADHRTWFRSQFVRMPDGRRPDGRRQSVLYFNPDAVGDGEGRCQQQSEKVVST